MHSGENERTVPDETDALQQTEAEDENNGVALKPEESHGEQLPQSQQRLCYSNGDDGRDTVGVLEAGQPEMENGVLVEATDTTVVVSAADHDPDLNDYSYRTINYAQITGHILHGR